MSQLSTATDAPQRFTHAPVREIGAPVAAAHRQSVFRRDPATVMSFAREARA